MAPYSMQQNRPSQPQKLSHDSRISHLPLRYDMLLPKHIDFRWFGAGHRIHITVSGTVFALNFCLMPG